MILHGDCLLQLKTLPDNSVDSIVTDPPYGLSFMGKKWDYDVPSVAIWQECLRVLKPGGHLLSFAGTRTYHRMACNIEDAGFEIRDQIMWLYGSGFPKSHAVDKGIDKLKGVARKVVGTKTEHNIKGSGENSRLQTSAGKRESIEIDITEATSDEAKQWQGWGTALKPANEPIVVARKPLEKGLTVAQNVLKYGTGALNIDASRIVVSENDPNHRKPSVPFTGRVFGVADGKSNGRPAENLNTQGRWPANVLLDEESSASLDLQVGDNVSRFFYVAKASKRERNQGLEGMPVKASHTMSGGQRIAEGRSEASGKSEGQNFHPTVKPIKLMEYLIKLVTPANGVVLDPFMGSGTTGVAAKKLGVQFIGIEREAEYLAIAEKRIEAAG